jgi:hypothetical protein
MRTLLKLTGEAAASILLLLVLAGPALAGDPINTIEAKTTVTADLAADLDLGTGDCSSSCDGDTTDLTVDADLEVTADLAADLDLGTGDCSSSCDGDTTDLTVDADLEVTADLAADLDLGTGDCSSSCDGDTTDLTVDADLEVTADLAADLAGCGDAGLVAGLSINLGQDRTCPTPGGGTCSCDTPGSGGDIAPGDGNSDGPPSAGPGSGGDEDCDQNSSAPPSGGPGSGAGSDTGPGSGPAQDADARILGSVSQQTNAGTGHSPDLSLPETSTEDASIGGDARITLWAFVMSLPLVPTTLRRREVMLLR